MNWGHEPASLMRAHHWLGRSSWADDDYFEGAIKSMQIWSRALDAAEVASLHALDGACLVTPSALPTSPTPTVTPAPTMPNPAPGSIGGGFRATARSAVVVVLAAQLALLVRG